MNKGNILTQTKDIITGSAGIALVDTTPTIIENVNLEPTNVVQIVVQLIIGVVTLIRLFKRKKE